MSLRAPILIPAALCAALCVAQPAAAQDEPTEQVAASQGINALVDRLSTRVAASLAAEVEDDRFRALDPAVAEGERATVTAVAMGVPDERQVDRVTFTVEQPGAGPRLLLVDAGLVLRGPEGADYTPVPNQRFILDQAKQELSIEVLPLREVVKRPPEGTALTAVWSNDPGLIAVLRTAQRIEAEDVARLRRYVKETEGALAVETFVDNEDVRLARWMTWYKDGAGQLMGKLPRDALRFAMLAVTEGYTIQRTADWLRTHRKMDMNPAIAAAWDLAKQTELILERAGLNHRVFSPAHADYHFNQGVAHFRANDLKAAEKSFRTAIDKQNNMQAAHYDLGVTLYREGKYAEAAEAMLVATGMPGVDANTFFNRGATLYRLDRKLNAARMFRKALELNAKDPDAKKWLDLADPDGVTKPKPKKKKRRRRRRRRKK